MGNYIMPLKDGEFFGEKTCIRPGRAMFTVRVTEHSQLLTLEHEDFEKLRMKHVEFNFVMHSYDPAVHALRGFHLIKHYIQFARRARVAGFNRDGRYCVEELLRQHFIAREICRGCSDIVCGAGNNSSVLAGLCPICKRTNKN